MQRHRRELRHRSRCRADHQRLYHHLRRLGFHLYRRGLCCFAFSTIIGWGLYGSRFLVFLCRSDKVAKPFFLVYSFVSILGATMDLGLLWSIADTFNGLMSIPNLLALLLLSGTVVRLTKEFFASEADCPQQKEAVARQLSKNIVRNPELFQGQNGSKKVPGL